MDEFFRFPHTPHIAWLGTGMPRDDKVLAPHEAAHLLSGPVVVEEKLDGANLGLSLAPDGNLRAQNRGQYLVEPYSGQFSRLPSWLGAHRAALTQSLSPELILFGEWCAAKHSLHYEALPDWFVVFDVYDRAAGRFWSSERRNAFTRELGLVSVPELLRGESDMQGLITLLREARSRYRTGPPEGIVIRRDAGDLCEARAKLVRAEFTQTIAEHWSSRGLVWNRVDPPA